MWLRSSIQHKATTLWSLHIPFIFALYKSKQKKPHWQSWDTVHLKKTHNSYNILMMQIHKQYMFSNVAQLSFCEAGSTGHACRTVMAILWFSVFLAPLYRVFSLPWTFLSLLLWLSKSLMERLLFILNEISYNIGQ